MQAEPARIAPLRHRAVIRIGGPDWAPFLKGLCTAHIDTIATESSTGASPELHYGAFLRPQGKMYADCVIGRTGVDEIRLDVPLSAREELLSRLNSYKLRARVTIAADDTPVFVAFGGPMPGGFTIDSRSRITGGVFGMAYEPRDGNATVEAWTDFRYALGLADPGYDFDMDALYAIDANLDLLDAIDFHKGCYVGQELTSRMKRRGQIKNRILPLLHVGVVAAGSEVLNGDMRAGNILRSVPGRSLALMRLDRREGALTMEGAEVSLVTPAWIDNVLT